MGVVCNANTSVSGSEESRAASSFIRESQSILSEGGLSEVTIIGYAGLRYVCAVCRPLCARGRKTIHGAIALLQ